MSVAGVIAAYNHEDYIAEAVRGLVDQVDELIVVNDASDDNTAAILDGMPHSHLRVVHNTRRMGVSNAYNIAVEVTSADILLIQGGDDRSLPNRAEVQVAILADPAVSLAYSLPAVIDDRGRELPSATAGEFFSVPAGETALERLFFGANYICAPSVAIRRADYIEGGGFRLGLDLLQDYALWLRLAAEGQFKASSSPVVEYRKHVSNLSREYVGLDSPRRRRFSAEMEFIRHHFAASSSEQTLTRLASAAKLDLKRFAALTKEDKVAMVELAHPDKLVLRRGLHHVLEIAGAPGGEARLNALGLSLLDLSTLAVAADHQNYAEVSSALAASRTFDSLATTLHQEDS